jgi:hypothetical protein
MILTGQRAVWGVVWAEQIGLQRGGDYVMQFQISTDRDTVTVHAHVARIEVEDIVPPDEDDPEEHYFRTIRFVSYSGEAIEVFCDTFDDKNALRLHRVKELKPVKKPKVRDWLLELEVNKPTKGKKKQ